jgi:tetratricopeptide (TPR) repeat protein
MGKVRESKKKLEGGSGLKSESDLRGGFPTSERHWFGRPVVPFLLVALVGILVYSNSLHVPFQWDENDFIVRNPVVKNLDYFLNPSRAANLDPDYYMFLKTRYLGYLTFALNYRLHGFNVVGYHLFNLAIHILSAFWVYVLTRLTFSTPVLRGSRLRSQASWIGLFAALLFVSHPVQTEAVTYIFQRHASFVTFFYLLTLVAYVKWRLAREEKEVSSLRSKVLYSLALIACVLAMKTKENAFTLPLSVAAYDFFFFKDAVKGRVLRLLPFFATLAIIPLAIVGWDNPLHKVITRAIDPASLLTRGTSSETYLFTQFRVLLTYVRLLFLPVHQNADYDFPLLTSFFNPAVLSSLLFHLVAVGAGVYLYFCSKGSRPEWRILSFGILWFYLTLSVESSIIPLKMIGCEYRIYLPSVWVLISIVVVFFALAGRLKLRHRGSERILIIFLTAIVLVYSILTFARNGVWKDDVALWRDVTRKSETNPRGYYNLGLAYAKRDRLAEATGAFQRVLSLDPSHAKAHLNLALIYDRQGHSDEAMKEFQRALELDPGDANTHYNLGITLARQGRLFEALAAFQQAIQLDPNDANARNNLGVIYGRLGRLEDAVREFKAALRINPDHVSAQNNLKRLSSSTLQP